MKSIKTIFNEVYSEGLAEYGFKKVPGKYPYFARMVGDEIIQVITYRTVSNGGPDLRQFVLLAGVITVYRKNLKFDVVPDLMTDQYGELMNLTEVIDFSERYMSYCTRNESYMKKVIDKSLINCKKYIIPVLNEIKSLQDCLEYYIEYKFYGQTHIYDYFSENFIKNGTDNSEGLLFYKCCDEQGCKELLKKYYEKEVAFKEKLIHSAENENIRETRIERMERFKESHKKNLFIIEQTYHDKEKMEYIQSVLEERRQRNMEELRRYKLL
jgi:hypothetical protein